MSNPLAPSPIRILVVDDNSVVRKTLRMNLEDRDELEFEITEAVDGVDAMERLRETRFALVLTDYDMPRMNGVDLTWAIRKHNDQIPVIMMSAHVNPDRLKEESGVDAFFSKGRYRMREVVEEIERLLHIPRCTMKHFVELRDGRRVFAQVCPKKK